MAKLLIYYTSPSKLFLVSSAYELRGGILTDEGFYLLSHLLQGGDYGRTLATFFLTDCRLIIMLYEHLEGKLAHNALGRPGEP